MAASRCWATRRIRCTRSAPTGASQAIIDGEALTQELSAGVDPEAGLQRYEQRRLPPMARIVESNRRKGIDIMLDIVEERAPQGFADLESVLPRPSSNASSATTRSSPPGPRDAPASGRAPIKNRPLSGPAVVAVYTGHHIAGRHRCGNRPGDDDRSGAFWITSSGAAPLQRRSSS
jgi:hypothetical protein